MKKIISVALLLVSMSILSGCCTDSICDLSSSYVPANTSKSCNNCSTCSACGYDTSYTYSGWY